MRHALLWLLAALVLGACAHTSQLADQWEGQSLCTLTNLHPDERRQRLYSANYQRPGLIPRCRKVRITDINERRMVFKLEATNREYTYFFSKDITTSIDDHIRKYFGTACSPNDTAGLSAVDQEGIAQGKVRVGMSKKGVIYAIGYPPEHMTPSLDLPVWRYWRNRFKAMEVSFAEGKVAAVRM